jgi:hypothetical protein
MRSTDTECHSDYCEIDGTCAYCETIQERNKLYSEVNRLKKQLHEYSTKLTVAADEIIAWKEASGLELGGDPDGVTPRAAQEFWDNTDKHANLQRAACQRALLHLPTCTRPGCDCVYCQVRDALCVTE